MGTPLTFQRFILCQIFSKGNTFTSAANDLLDSSTSISDLQSASPEATTAPAPSASPETAASPEATTAPASSASPETAASMETAASSETAASPASALPALGMF